MKLSISPDNASGNGQSSKEFRAIAESSAICVGCAGASVAESGHWLLQN
jgi:hypothetical protein